MKRIYLSIILLLMLIFHPLFINSIIAQPPPPPPQEIPLDGSLFLLLIAGLLYGGRKLYKERKNSKV